MLVVKNEEKTWGWLAGRVAKPRDDPGHPSRCRRRRRALQAGIRLPRARHGYSRPAEPVDTLQAPSSAHSALRIPGTWIAGPRKTPPRRPRHTHSARARLPIYTVRQNIYNT